MLAFDLAEIPESERFDFWAALGGRTFATTASPNDRERISVRSTTWSLRPLILTRFESTPFTTIRGDAELRAEPGDFIKIKLYTAGQTYISHGDDVDVLRHGAIHIIDQSRPKIEVSTKRAHLALMVPHADVGYDPARHPIVRSLASGTGDGAVLADALMTLEAAMKGDPAGQHLTHVDPILSALRDMLGPKAGRGEEGDRRAARRAALRRLVAANPMSTLVGVDALANRFNISRASVYRAFSSYGGVERFRMRCRLGLAFRLLVETVPRRGVVTQTAERLAFSSDSHFVRAFRLEFGMSPGEIVGMAPPLASYADTAGKRLELTSDLAALRGQLTEVYSRFRVS